MSDLELREYALNDARLTHCLGRLSADRKYRVSFYYTQITDKGLRQLEAYPNIIELDLRGTKATERGVRQLQKALPNCRITW